MLRFTKLRLTGFKSFVDPAELEIAPGLTGIVGPNGCGKSNLLEALRWVMGESSARQMRAGEMEDVIFAGCAGRPARALAEVAICLAGPEERVPAVLRAAGFGKAGRGGKLSGGAAETGGGDGDGDEADRSVELDVRRRIERSRGSSYRVNGREARARDVQLLFADAASGARSAAMVTQGQVAELILARPSDRRLLLDEAAGISGIQPRRHEAELRLRAAETNLERLDDVLATLTTQHDHLRKQGRQAQRYRSVCARIRKTEAGILRARWAAAEAGLATARERLARAEGAVSEAGEAAAGAACRQAEAAAALPAVRAEEADASAALRTLGVTRDTLEADARRSEAERDAARRRLDQATADLARARALSEDAAANLARVASERARLVAAGDSEDLALAEAEAAVGEAVAAVAALDRDLAAVGERIARGDADRAALTRSLAELDDAVRRLDRRSQEIARQRCELDARAAAVADLASLDAGANEAESALERARTAAEAAETRRTALAAAEIEARDELRRTEAALAAQRAEIDALETMLAAAGAGAAGPRLLDRLRPEPGWEVALAAGLGDDLTASLDPGQPIHWRALQPAEDPGEAAAIPALPPGVVALADQVGAAAPVARRLAQIGVVANADEGDRLQPALRPGQRLVGRDGGLWRWDGLVVAAGAPSPAAVLLEQRARLGGLCATRAACEGEHAATARRAGDAGAAAAGARDGERAARERLRAAELAARRAREALAEGRHAAAEVTTRLAAIDEAEAVLAREHAEVDGRRNQAAAALDALPDNARDRADQDRLRAGLRQAREREREARAACDTVRRDIEGRRRRLVGLERDAAAWTARRNEAQAQITELEARQAAERADLARLEAQPGEIKARQQALLESLEMTAKRRQQAADALAAADAALAAADRDARVQDKALAAAREERVRAEADLSQAERIRQDCGALIEDRLGVGAEALGDLADEAGAPAAGGDGDAGIGDAGGLEAAERRLERLKRERETMGPVNLRAEDEAAEVSQRIESLNGQREDLTAAIAKLRRGIADLDREGRERLAASFAAVDGHFRALFSRLFGGGQAHLSLTDADDPLEAGLEIMACPPGKKLQTLSLLSGGEQVLTALALRFAVFLSNPAPVCVLDEVDAPLDDANVDRFCTLLSEMAGHGTRFLVITHHRMTMARMDRLFGVTMAERGVSQLVCVDLQHAESLRETA